MQNSDNDLSEYFNNWFSVPGDLDDFLFYDKFLWDNYDIFTIHSTEKGS